MLHIVLDISLCYCAAMRHSSLVRVTHWITTLSFFGLLISGIAILVAHPRLYWGETGALDGSPRDVPLFAATNRHHVRTGLLASVTHQRGAHVFKAGTEVSRMGLRESFTFSVTDPDVALDAGLSERTLQFDAGNPFSFHDSATPMLWSFYVQDSVRPFPRRRRSVTAVRRSWARWRACSARCSSSRC